jgi:hypothetical protein
MQMTPTTPGTPAKDALAPLAPLAALSPLRRAAYIAIGSVSLVLGIIGAVLPGMPSTVFFLITIGCYTRSSERLYRWLMSRVWLQRPMRSALTYREHKAIPVRIKVLAQGVAWSSASFLIFSGRTLFAQALGIAFALSCSIAMALIPTLPDGRRPRVWGAGAREALSRIGFGALAGLAGGLAAAISVVTLQRLGANITGAAPFAVPTMTPIAATSCALGLAAGMVYSLVRRVLPADGWLRGGLFALMACVVFGPVLVVRSAVFGVNPAALVIALLLPAVAACGLLVSLVFERLGRSDTGDL